MKLILYASVVASLMYAKVCTDPETAYFISMLGRYQTNHNLDHWKFAMKVLQYLCGTKNCKHVYKKGDNL